MSSLRVSSSLNYQIILVSVALGLLLISLALPWLVVNLFGQRSYTALDNMKVLANMGEENTSRNDIVLSDLRSVYPDSSSAFVLSMAALYPASIAAMIATLFLAILKRKNNGRRRTVLSSVVLAAGALAIIAALLWMYSIQSFKSQFSRDADLSGGIIGEEWKGKASVFVDRLIVMGFAHYIVISAGVIAIFAYVIEKYDYQKRQDQKHHHSVSDGEASS